MGSRMSKAFETVPPGGYVLRHTLFGHTGPINCLRFSPDGTLLASGGDDNRLRIWSMRSGTCMQVLRTTINGPVTDIAWCSNEGTGLYLLFSSAYGTIYVYYRSTEKGAVFKSVTKVRAHSAAIEGMDFDPLRRRLATCGGGEVKIWNIHPDHDWSMSLLAYVPSDGYIARSVHFSEGGKCVTATYLDSQEIKTWNLEPWRMKRNAQIFTRIGNSAISPDGQTILVHNFVNGVDAYEMSNMVRKATYQTPVDRRRPKQIMFGDEGSLVVHGSDRGVVYISDFVTADLFQTLHHSSSSTGLVQAVTTHRAGSRYFLASGSADNELTVKVWVKNQASSSNTDMEDFPWACFALIIVIVLIFVVPRTGILGSPDIHHDVPAAVTPTSGIIPSPAAVPSSIVTSPAL